MHIHAFFLHCTFSSISGHKVGSMVCKHAHYTDLHYTGALHVTSVAMHGVRLHPVVEICHKYEGVVAKLMDYFGEHLCGDLDRKLVDQRQYGIQ